jgi:hypothetical protein
MYENLGLIAPGGQSRRRPPILLLLKILQQAGVGVPEDLADVDVSEIRA